MRGWCACGSEVQLFHSMINYMPPVIQFRSAVQLQHLTGKHTRSVQLWFFPCQKVAVTAHEFGIYSVLSAHYAISSLMEVSRTV